MRLSSHKSPRRRKLELQMTSMIDVVFLLLIFFMVTMTLVPTERNLDSGIKVERSQNAAGADLTPAIIDVVSAGGGFVYRLGGRQFTSHEELTPVLRQFPNKSEGAFVRVHDDVPYGMPAAAIQAAKDAGFPAVTYVPVEAN